MDIISPIITPVVESLLVPIKRHLDFLFSSTKYDREMRVKLTELNSTAIFLKRRREEYDVKNLRVPDHVPIWFEQVDVVDREAGSISAGRIGCLHMTRRYKVGKQCSDLIKRIERLMQEKQNMDSDWTNEERLLGRVPTIALQVLQDFTQNVFMSRRLISQRALELLEPADSTAQMVALCGMGGIGKTTMMEELKKDVENTKLFDHTVRVVVGNSTDTIAFQDAIAQYAGGNLSESTKEARADRLKERFLGMSQDGKKKILIILDDLWNIVDLKDIGLASPLPKGFKLFLTSRDETLCLQMGVETSSVLRMVGLQEVEAKKLFWETGLSDGVDDHELRKLGEDIVKRCGGLPLAIKTIALALKGKTKDAWRLTLLRLCRHNLQDLQGRYDVVRHIFKISYEGLQIDDQKVFVLSGLFPDDSYIPLEDLMRYGWGLKLFDGVHSLFEARLRTNASVHNLIRLNLLVESDRKGSVKMHDLARSFVLSNILEFKQASIVNHSDTSEWPTQDTRESCERILLNCKGMSEFPGHFDYPDLKLMTLMKIFFEKKHLIFPEDFYTRMKKLQVISYDGIKYPSLPKSLQCSTSLRVLCLRSCSLMDDLSDIGHLSNLEILSFAYCGIINLPSAVGKLGKLKLLSLTGCDELCIGDGVFQKLNNLEELYLRNRGGKVISFTKDNCEGLEMVSKKLLALEVEFFENMIRPNNVSFKKLERFRVSIGCQLYDSVVISYENTLGLVASRKEVHAFEINELFEKTETLHLQVEDINHLEDVLMHPSQYAFCNLKHLSFEKCATLKYLFTVDVASTLANLETLTVVSCGVLGYLIHDENNGVRVIKFRKLKLLELAELPMFVGLCDNINTVMHFPQLVRLNIYATTIPLLNNECSVLWSLGQYSREIIIRSCDALSTVIPSYAAEQPQKIEALKIIDCSSMTEVFETEELKNSLVFGQGSGGRDNTTPAVIPRLKSITTHKMTNLQTLEINRCHRLVDIFTFSTLGSLGLLKNLSIRDCRELKVIVREEHGEQTMTTSKAVILFPRLKSIEIIDLPNLKGFFFGMNEFQLPLLDEVMIRRCPQMTVFTSLPLKAPKLKYIHINGGKYCTPECCSFFTTATFSQIPSQHSDNANSLTTISGEFLLYPLGLIEMNARDDWERQVILSYDEVLQLENLEKLTASGCESVEEVFDIGTKGRRSNSSQTVLKLPKLTDVHLWELNTLKCIWKSNGRTMMEFPNLTILSIHYCKRIEHVFTCSMVGSLLQLKKLYITECEDMEVIVKEDEEGGDDGKVNEITLPCLKHLQLKGLPSLKGFCLGNMDYSLPSLDKMKIKDCKSLTIFTKGGLLVPELKFLKTSLGDIDLAQEQHINSFIIAKTQEGFHFGVQNKNVK